MSCTNDEYEVGYKHPPLETRWKPGQCGNPRKKYRRRPKQLAQILDETLNVTIKIDENGEPCRLSVLEAIILRLWEKGMKGNKRAQNELVKYLISDVVPERRREIMIEGGLPKDLPEPPPEDLPAISAIEPQHASEREPGK